MALVSPGSLPDTELETIVKIYSCNVQYAKGFDSDKRHDLPKLPLVFVGSNWSRLLPTRHITRSIAVQFHLCVIRYLAEEAVRVYEGVRPYIPQDWRDDFLDKSVGVVRVMTEHIDSQCDDAARQAASLITAAGSLDGNTAHYYGPLCGLPEGERLVGVRSRANAMARAGYRTITSDDGRLILGLRGSTSGLPVCIQVASADDRQVTEWPPSSSSPHGDGSGKVPVVINSPNNFYIFNVPPASDRSPTKTNEEDIKTTEVIEKSQVDAYLESDANEDIDLKHGTNRRKGTTPVKYRNKCSR